jgi:hypothetical protein
MAWENDPLVLPQPKWESDPIIEAAPITSPVTGPAIQLGPGLPIPQVLQPSANPNSAGLYPIGFKFSVGDSATYRTLDLLTGNEQRTFSWRVTKVDEDADRVEVNNGANVTDMLGNYVKLGNRIYDVPRQIFPAEVYVGKKWNTAYRGTVNGATYTVKYAFHILRREVITIPAGSFSAFRAEGEGFGRPYNNILLLRQWIVPGLNFPIRREFLERYNHGFFYRTDRDDLVSLRQNSFAL